MLHSWHIYKICRIDTYWFDQHDIWPKMTPPSFGYKLELAPQWLDWTFSFKNGYPLRFHEKPINQHDVRQTLNHRFINWTQNDLNGWTESNLTHSFTLIWPSLKFSWPKRPKIKPPVSPPFKTTYFQESSLWMKNAQPYYLFHDLNIPFGLYNPRACISMKGEKIPVSVEWFAWLTLYWPISS